MPILKPLQFQKTVQYNTILEDEIHFSESMASIMQKLGKPNSTDETAHLTTLFYERMLSPHIASAYYCFEQKRLCSVCYETDVLDEEDSEHFLSAFEERIKEGIYDSIIRYRSCGKEYWELSDGEVYARICLYKENNKSHIRIDYFD